MPRDARRTFALPETTFSRCPRSHELPNQEDGIDCTSDRCALDVEEPEVPISGRPVVSANGEAENDARRLRSRKILTDKLVPTPKGLEGADAENYVAKKLVSLSVPAVQVLEKQLLYGTDEEQRKSAKDILLSNGHGPRERGGQGANMIVINMGGSGPPPPLPYVGEVVEAATKALSHAQK